jgi:hypothetical protein
MPSGLLLPEWFYVVWSFYLLLSLVSGRKKRDHRKSDGRPGVATRPAELEGNKWEDLTLLTSCTT